MRFRVGSTPILFRPIPPVLTAPCAVGNACSRPVAGLARAHVRGKTMDRREFLNVSAATTLAGALPNVATAAPAAALEAPPITASWRTFEVVTEVEIWPQDIPAKVWLPIAQYGDTDYQRTLDVCWTGNPSATGIYRDPVYGAPAFFAQWDDRAVAPALQVTNRIVTRNRNVELTKPGPAPLLSRDEIDLYLQPTSHIPTDGIVRATATKILPMSSTNPIERARAIYNWIVVNTYRDPKVIGCGTGDIKFMLESGNLGGKCADLNALFVGLARSVGIPARDLYGVRVADSATWKSLGKSGDITKAQHCRAEFFDSRFGWIPVDPADVRKVVLEEEKDRLLPLDDPRVDLARKTLFGRWEMNWMAFNAAGDTRLAPETTKALGHFMYPYAETAKGQLDYYNPQNFQYRMRSREVKG
jgi:transglutaminase-like putative cysteine protease